MKFPLLKEKAVLAPMAFVTDVAFRELARRYGAGLTYTEFVSGEAITRESPSYLKKIEVSPNEKPCAVQLFGGKTETLITAAKFLEKKFDIIDINMGCPSENILRVVAGCSLLNNPKKIEEVVRDIVSAVKVPVTVKIRIGINSKKINAVAVAKAVERGGGAAITVHGRTQEQGYSGKADWKIIKQVKEAVSIPVIGNGDVRSPEDFKEKLDSSGVDYVMIGRAAMGNPFIFTQIKDYLKTGRYNIADNRKILSDYLKIASGYEIPFIQIRQHALNFSKGMQDGAKLRVLISKTKNVDEIKRIMNIN